MTRRRHSTTARAKLFHAKGGICHLCGGLVQAGEAWDISHVIPLAIGGADDETNWDVAHRKCHRAHTATVDAPRIAKTKRQHHQHIGAKTKSARGFPPANPRRPATTPLAKQLPPRRLGQ